MDFFLFVSNRYIYDENSKNTIFYCFIAKYIVIWLDIFSQLVTSTSHDMTLLESNNETVSRQNLRAGNIAKSMTSKGNSCCLPFTKISGKSGWKVNGTRPFRSSKRKISGSNGTSEKVVLFSRWNTPNRSSCSISSKASLVSVSRLCGRFPVKGTDLYSCKRDSSSGTRFTSPELCEPFTQTVNRPVHQCKW